MNNEINTLVFNLYKNFALLTKPLESSIPIQMAMADMTAICGQSMLLVLKMLPAFQASGKVSQASSLDKIATNIILFRKSKLENRNALLTSILL